jgi:hypothetical protein
MQRHSGPLIMKNLRATDPLYKPYGPSDCISFSLFMHLCFFFNINYNLPPIISYTFMNFHIQGRALGFHRRNSRGDWHLYRRPSADDRRGSPKPGRCIKHNHHGVFPVGISQSCGNPSFQLSDILFLFLFLVFFLLLLYCETTISFQSSLSYLLSFLIIL